MVGTLYSSCIFVHILVFLRFEPQREELKAAKCCRLNPVRMKLLCFNCSCWSRDSAASERMDSWRKAHPCSPFWSPTRTVRARPRWKCVGAVFRKYFSCFFFCHSCHTHCCFIKRFLPITSLLSVINANQSRNCGERLLISSCAAPAPNLARLPQNKTHANGSKTLKDLHTSAGDVLLHLILASKQFD